MRRTILLSFLGWLITSGVSFASCIPFTQAAQHIGETKCISGVVARVNRSKEGLHYLNFCDEKGACPFAAVIRADDLRHVGDVRGLQGKAVEVHGDVRGSEGGAQILVSESRQLKGAGATIPPLPRHYDVEQRGHYSAGTFSHPQSGRSTGKKRQLPKLPADLPEDRE
jgi:hypothetical protein